MKAATIKEIKEELKYKSPNELVNYCLRLARFKKENKELLTYLLFESANEAGYVESVKAEIDEQFKTLNRTNTFLAKKTVRKVLNATNKYIRYSGNKQTEAELLIYFCKSMLDNRIPIKKSRVLSNIYERQILRISKAVGSLHEDLKFDYSEAIEEILIK